MSHTNFDAFGLPPKLAQALARMQFTAPTPIQEQTIPLALEGRDVLGSAQTGTGKTGAFGIPVIAGLMNNPDAAALIMTPTRELAGQVMKALEPMIPIADIRTAVLIGGEAMPRQFHQLRNNPRLIVGTPGRINDHLERGTLKLGNVRYLVLDETDRMLDMGFGIQIERILKHVSDERQTLLFSATLPHNITKLSGKYMKNPARVAVGSTIAPAAKIKQEVITVTDGEKYTKLVEQIEARKGSIIIFVKTKHGTERLADRLNKGDHRADAIHGDLQQRRRERVIQSFRDKKFRILVATDVAARGLDIPHIAHVINYDMPQAPEDYIHRIGRTARAGAEGEAVSFLTAADNQKWRAIQRLMGGEDPNMPQTRSPGGRSGARSGPRRSSGPSGKDGGGGKPFWKKDRDWKRDGDKPRAPRSHEDKPREARAHDGKPRDERPREDRAREDRLRDDRPGEARPHSARADGERSYAPKPWGAKARDGKPRTDRPHGHKSEEGQFAGGGKSYGYKPRGPKAEGQRTEERKFSGSKFSDRKPSGPRSDDHKPRDSKPAKGRSFGGGKFGDSSGGGKKFGGGGSKFGGASHAKKS